MPRFTRFEKVSLTIGSLAFLVLYLEIASRWWPVLRQYLRVIP